MEVETTLSMDTSDDSFVHIDDVEQPSLTLKIVPRHDTIGIDAGKKSTEFCATTTARNLPDDDSQRAPVDIVVALDVSGSMNGTKLDLCKSTLDILLRELRSTDRFGLISFGSDAKIEIPPRKLDQTNREYALAKIKKMTTRGCTNMSGGIGLAAQELKSIESPHEVRAMFLLTDGIANEGICSREGIAKLTKNILGSKDGESPIPIHCFGYGSDHEREMLRDISQATPGGTYYFVDNDSDVSSAFGDALGGVLSVVAQNTTVTLKVPEEASAHGVSILNVKHDRAIQNNDGSFTVTLNDFYAEESRDIIFEVALSNESSVAPIVHITSSLSYLDTINSKLVQNVECIGSIIRPNGDEVSPSNGHISLQCIRIKTTEVIAEAKQLADNGNLDNAKTKITSYIDQLQNEKTSSEVDKSNPLVVQMLTELNSILSGLSSRQTYQSYGGHYMQTRVMTHAAQRCAESCEGSTNAYKSSSKAAYAKRLKSSAKRY